MFTKSSTLYSYPDQRLPIHVPLERNRPNPLVYRTREHNNLPFCRHDTLSGVWSEVREGEGGLAVDSTSFLPGFDNKACKVAITYSQQQVQWLVYRAAVHT